VYCRRCGSLYVSPRLSDSEAQDIYREEVRWTERDRPVYDASERVTTFERIEHEATRLLGGAGRLLDAGCGAGGFMAYMRDRGWEVQGVDINPLALEMAREKGLDVRMGTLDRLPDHIGEFDLIASQNALTYMADPLGAVGCAARHLRPGGLVVVEDANTDLHVPLGRLSGLLGRSAYRMTVAPYPPRRLYAFSPRGMRLLFRKAGLDPVTVIAAGSRLAGSAAERWTRRLLYTGGEALFRLTGGRRLFSPAMLAFGRAAR